ncbi:MAG: peptidoglycan bridge formation glycyltransferase FemA/FemB family protein [Anaerolineae bacterium]|nr:peptidoglycan bridge formation glycyltransferase FemA/FemB family protein [Anaerolineae bacterium]
MYQAIECLDPIRWDAALLRLPQPHILQSWAWGETKQQTGWRAKRLLWFRTTPPSRSAEADSSYQPANSFAAAAAAILIRRLAPRLPLAVAYVPKGPLLDWADEALAEAVLSRLEAEARRAGALFVKIDPDLRSDTVEGQQIMALLARRGWRASAEQIQFRNTMISDLTRDEDALLAAMKPKWRYNIRLAERRGVVVRDGTAADLPVFYAMYGETGLRDGFLVRPYEYYRAIWERFMAERLAHLLLAEVEGRPVAGLILFRFGPTAWYFYGASTAHSRELMPNHALQWAAMRWAKAAGCTRYDWWGAPDVLDEADPMWGVYRFKQGFGGEFVPHIGAWDYPTSRLGYWGYTVVMPRVLDLMRRRHRTPKE